MSLAMSFSLGVMASSSSLLLARWSWFCSSSSSSSSSSTSLTVTICSSPEGALRRGKDLIDKKRHGFNHPKTNFETIFTICWLFLVVVSAQLQLLSALDHPHLFLFNSLLSVVMPPSDWCHAQTQARRQVRADRAAVAVVVVVVVASAISRRCCCCRRPQKRAAACEWETGLQAAAHGHSEFAILKQ